MTSCVSLLTPHVYMYVYMYVCMHVCIYVCMYVCVYVCVYVLGTGLSVSKAAGAWR